MQTILTIPKTTVEVEEQSHEIVRVIIEVDRNDPLKGEIHLLSSTATSEPMFVTCPVADLVEQCAKAYAASIKGAKVETIINEKKDEPAEEEVVDKK
jgi:hypothetical protein